MMLKLYYLVLWIDQVMNEIINKIKDAVYRIPTKILIHPTSSGIPYWYQQGLVDGRQQALNIITQHHQENCEHVYGNSDGSCLNCNFQA